MAVCSEIHTKHINTLCGQNVELLNVRLAVHIVTTGLKKAYFVPNTIRVNKSLPVCPVCKAIHSTVQSASQDIPITISPPQQTTIPTSPLTLTK